MKFATKPMRQ